MGEMARKGLFKAFLSIEANIPEVDCAELLLHVCLHKFFLNIYVMRDVF